MDINLTLNPEEIIRINNEVKGVSESIVSLVRQIDGGFTDLTNNVSGSTVRSLSGNIQTKLRDVNTKIGVSFGELTTFMDTQANNYTNLYQSALNMLTQAFAFIEQSF